MIQTKGTENEALKKPPVAYKILLIGGYGFVGSQVLKLLDGYDISVYDNLLSGPALSTAPYIYGDIRNDILLHSIIPDYDIIVHLAGIVGEPACSLDPTVAYDINVLGTKNIISSLNANQKYIYISSTSVYGDVDSKIIVNEDSSINPTNHYARHKAISESLIKNLCKAKYIIMRPATAFGISDRIRLDLLVNTFIFQALDHGYIEVFEPEIIRPIIHVFDFARAIKFAIDDHMSWNETYNIGNPSLTMYKLVLAEKIASLCDATVIIGKGSSLDPRNYYVSFEKILESGFIFSDNSLELAIDQFKENLLRISLSPERFSTPELFAQFLKERNNV